MDNADPMRTIPKTESADPTRQYPRNDKELPKYTKSRIDIAEPRRDMP